jgi:hypothetical protein
MGVPVPSPVATLPPVRRPVRAVPRGGRSLASYLVLPRPGDLGKAVIVPAAFALGTAAVGGTSMTRAWHAALVWFVLELLVYQARYQWNDVRGFHADQRHPDSASRGRLPGPVDRARPHITASLGVAVVRLVVAAVVAICLPAVRVTVVAMTVGVFGVAAIYETLRSVATGRQACTMPVRVTPALRGLWVAVGAGYAVRGVTGLSLAIDLRHRVGAAIAAVTAMWALGVVFVTCRWALEALCFARFVGADVRWAVPSGAAREHSLALARWLPSAVVRIEPDVRGPKQWRALSGKTPLTAPWNVAFLLAAAAAALTGRMLAAPTGTGEGMAALVIGAAAAYAVAGSTRRRLHLLGSGLVAVAVLAAIGVDRGWVAGGVATVLVVVAYVWFTRQRADDIGQSLRWLTRG